MFLIAFPYLVVLLLGVVLWRQRARVQDAEKRQREQKAMLDGLFRQQSQFMAVLSIDGVLLNVSDSVDAVASRQIGKKTPIRKNEVVGKHFWEAYWFDAYPQARTEWEERLHLAAQSVEPIEFIDNFAGDDLAPRHVKGVLTAIKGDDGAVKLFVLHAIDVTAAIRVESDLREAHHSLEAKAKQLTTTLSSISQGIFMIGEDGRVSTFNPRVCELLNLTAEYLESRPSLQEVTQFQLERGDFGGPSAEWVNGIAQRYVASGAQGEIPDSYLRKRRDGRILEVKTQTLASGGMVRTFTDVTDYIQAEQVKQRLTTLLQASQSMAGVGGWEVDVITHKVFWTDEVFRILDTHPQAFQPTVANTLQFYAPEWVPVMQGVIRDAERYAKSHDLEVEMITAKGRRIWVHSKSTLTVEGGKVVKRMAVIQDITAKKLSDAALRASEDLFRQVTSQVPGMVYRLTITPQGDRRYSFVSPGVRELYGLEPEEVLADGNVLHTFRHPDEREMLQREMQYVHATNGSLSVDFRIILRDGTQKWVQLTSSSISTSDGGAVRNGVIIDITARKRAEADLREQDAMWKLALESTGDGVWDWYVQSGIETLSQRCLEMYGYGEGDLNPQPEELDARTHPDDVEQMNRDRQAHFDGETPSYVNEHRIQCKDGTWKWILTRGMVISRDAQGKPLRMIGTHTDISERKKTQALIWQQANFDALTNLPNRRMLHDRLEQDLKKTRREGQKLALLFIDLDHFKEVNDTLGHHQGDNLLVEASARIRQCVRGTDTVARMGGDEFTVVLPSLHDTERLDGIVQSLLTELSKPFMLDEEQAYISASIGITVCPDDGVDIDELLKNADQALYQAKGAGRNRFSYFTPALQQTAQVRARLAADLRNALAQDQFWIAYQPIVELRTGRVHKAEALLRWTHPTLGLVSPARFIPIAESNGQIVSIGDWVFHQAAKQVMAWRHSHDPHFQVSVNKSPVQFNHHDSSQQSWFDQLDALGLPGQGIIVEITEGLLLDASARVTAQMLAFRDAGVGVSLDDFGTGYSSLHYLQNHDIDFLKIDKSFVRDLTESSKDLALCKAIILMAHELGMKVVAEGVETPLQRSLLLEAGCDYGQGYLFAQPMSADDFTAYLAKGQ